MTGVLMQYALLDLRQPQQSATLRARSTVPIAEVLARPYIGGWVRLHADESATTVRGGAGQPLLTDGPFIESKEFLAGLILVEAPDLDHALEVAQELQQVTPALRSKCGPHANGCSVALDAVFREHWGRVLATLVGILGDIELAEDAAQEAFAIAAQRWPRDGEPENPVGWLIATARNRAIDHIRRQRVLAEKTKLLAHELEIGSEARCARRTELP